MGKVIYLSRHGQSEYNVQDKLGGNSDITDSGVVYSKNLFDYIENENLNKLKVYTSCLNRTIQTAKYFRRTTKLNFLNEINAGIFEDKTYDFIKKKHNKEYQKRKSDKFNYRYPEGESYLDLQNRISQIFTILNENLKEDEPSLIICHNAVVRLIYGNLLKIPNERIPYIDIPLHTLFKFEEIGDNKFRLSSIKL